MIFFMCGLLCQRH